MADLHAAVAEVTVSQEGQAALIELLILLTTKFQLDHSNALLTDRSFLVKVHYHMCSLPVALIHALSSSLPFPPRAFCWLPVAPIG